MSELHNARTMLDKAEDAARAGDFTSADRLLRDIARIQEAELGPQHPELANTLNNLAIVAERGGRPEDAESFYRRSAAIASASLPADHPMVVTSRQNLDAFRRARQSSIDTPSMKVSPKDADLGLDVFAREGAASKSEEKPDKPQPPTQPVEPTREPGARVAGSRLWLAIAAVALVTVGVLASRPWTLGDQPEPSPTASPPEEAPAPPANVEPASPPPEVSAPPAAPPTASSETEPAPFDSAQGKPAASTQPDAPEVVTEAPPASTASSDAITLTTAQLCRSLSTGSWRCDPAGENVGRGPIVFYTRVKSPRGGTVVHRWYRGDDLRRSVPLTVRANPAEGFRTYSRLTVDEAGDWRVEARTEEGDLLHELRFTVQ